MIQYRNKAAALATAGALMGTTALWLAPNAFARRAAKTGGLSRLDKDFLKAANGGNLSEVAYAPVVLRQAAGQDAKNFAQRMVQDHTKANNELKMVARKKGVKLPGKVPDEERDIIDRLAQEHGA
jgi:putative membrane protein